MVRTRAAIRRMQEEPVQKLKQSKEPAPPPPPPPPPPPVMVMVCSICYRSPTDPVMTICGHLYCWPCIYNWLSRSAEDDRHQLFPVPKSCPLCRNMLRISVDVFPVYATVERWTQTTCTGGCQPVVDNDADSDATTSANVGDADDADLAIPRRPHMPIVSTYAYMLQMPYMR